MRGAGNQRNGLGSDLGSATSWLWDYGRFSSGLNFHIANMGIRAIPMFQGCKNSTFGDRGGHHGVPVALPSLWSLLWMPG